MRRSWLRLFLAGVIVAGILTGYLVSSGLGRRLLHQEIETQLGRLLSGRVTIAEVELRFVDGLRFEARGLEAYPNADPEGQPALRASRVLAWIDFLALLIGRLELSTLVLEGPHLRVEQAADGSFPGLPLPNFVLLPDPAGTTMLGEHFVQQLESLEPAASVFREHFRAADRIEILDGTVNWIDRRNLSKDGTPRELRLELISGVAERDWLSDAISVESSAVFVDGRHAPFPIEMELDNAKLTGNLQVGKLVTLKTRKARPQDCICSNESAYYPPLVKLAGFVPGVTIEGDVSARALGSRWSIPDSRTAYLGKFHYK